jgi:hypothetical protein
MNAQITAVDPTATICLRRTVLIQLWINLPVRSITLIFQGYNKALRFDVQWTTAQKDANIAINIQKISDLRNFFNHADGFILLT